MAVHVPVLLQKIIEYLQVEPGKNFLDATCGEGGYAKAILEASAPQGKVLAIDWNQEVLEELKKDLSFGKRLETFCGNFKDLDQAVLNSSIKNFHGAVFDLGLSRFLVEKSGRGFSFLRDEPLLMSYEKDSSKTAEEIVNHASKEELERIFRDYGEERFSKRIAEVIFRRRPIDSSLDLAKLIEGVVPRKNLKTHPATRIFQALRIAVNGEFENLRQALPEALKNLVAGGRLVVVSYHSLEDKITKQMFKDFEKNHLAKLVLKKPLLPDYDEVKKNPAARSAKLRVVEKI